MWQEEESFEVLKCCYVQIYATSVLLCYGKAFILQLLWNFQWSNVELLQKKQRNTTYITKFVTVFLRSNWSNVPRKYWSKIRTDRNVLSCGPKASNISGISDAISPRFICKNPRSMQARVPQAMAQFVLKIKKQLCHIIGTAPILERACAYGLRLRLY